MAAALGHRLFELMPFYLGTVIKWPDVTAENKYSNTALSQFSSFTPERLLKAAALRPSRNAYNWREADAFFSFSDTHKKKVHGHTLLWDRDLPDWIQHITTPDPSVLEEHVLMVTERYKNRVRGWDVVNEAFDENGTLKSGIWHRIAGEDYIKKAFYTAHAQDADALLFYNDFDLETNHIKRRGVLRYLLSLKNSGVPIHGIGMQLHLNISSANVSKLEEALKEIAEAGFYIHLSELDVSVNPYNGVISAKEELYKAQAKLFWLVFEKYLQVPPPLRYGITFWGVGDGDSWLTGDLKHIDFPLLFDEDYEPKPAWYTLVSMFNGKHGDQ